MIRLKSMEQNHSVGVIQLHRIRQRMGTEEWRINSLPYDLQRTKIPELNGPLWFLALWLEYYPLEKKSSKLADILREIINLSRQQMCRLQLQLDSNQR